MYLYSTSVRTEGFLWDYEAPNMEFYWSSTQTAEFLKKCSYVFQITCNLSNFNVEGVAQRWSVKKVFLEISQNSQENSSATVSFLMKLQIEACNFLLKKWLWHSCSPLNFAKFLRAPFLTKHFRWLLLSIRSFKIQNNFFFAFGIWLKHFC